MNNSLFNANSPQLIVIAGPTASGKTAAAIALAKHFNTVIVSADSRQFYREMSIGTAKPSDAELAGAQHYFINSHSIHQPFSVGNFERECIALLNELFRVYDKVVLVGGSGLFIRAITDGFDELPSANELIRQKLNKELIDKGIEYLQRKLKIADPNYYSEVDIDNPQRIIRALEVFEVTGKPFSSYRKATVNKRPFRIIKLALNLDRQKLYDRINQRVDVMLNDGLVDEVRSLIPYSHLNALNTVGYSELFDHFKGNSALPAAIELVKQNTRRFAKRQITWFKKDTETKWFEADGPHLIQELISTIENEQPLT